MLTRWRHRRAVRRIKAGDGRPLKPFRWWQLLGRILFHLDLDPVHQRRTEYAIDVRRGGNREDGSMEADLYLDGRHHARSKTPAAFPVAGGQIEVATTMFGVKRCHYVTDDGAERQLTPDPRSAEGRRTRLDHEHPALSRWIGVGSVVLVVIGIGLNLLQLIEPVSAIPPVAAAVGTFTSPIDLPLWLNVILGLGAALGSTERAFRLRYHWLLDAAGN